MSMFLPLVVEGPLEAQLISPLCRVGPVIVPAPPSPDSLAPNTDYYVLIDNGTNPTADEITDWLNEGAEKVIVPLSRAKELRGLVPPERLMLLLDVGNASAVTDTIRGGFSGVLLRTHVLDVNLISSVSAFFSGCDMNVLCSDTEPPSLSSIRLLNGINARLVLPTSHLTVGPSSATQINVADAFLAPLISDRADGLFPTVVSSYSHGGRTLGLVYSSHASVKESILSGKGVYHSRKHGLWRKGETSGATQDVVRIRVDCDSDTLEYSVVQHGAGFCHMARSSCFGSFDGLARLHETLRTRRESAPEGSYTRRLFEDPGLLRSKIMEEADELCTAETTEEVAFEAADLLYFALTRCVAAGVGLADIERSLDAKAKRITKRPGNAKPQWSTQPQEIKIQPPAKPSQAPTEDPQAPIRMRTFDLAALGARERAQLLRRPVLRSDEMIAKVRPIVEDVRTRGDVALLELTAKFDGVRLASALVRPPFDPHSTTLPDDVRAAIDVAYKNIRTFHEAQVGGGPLVVETMPGVVCTRFVRPIARVGLYVPGGTAVLPSTALMLGVPAEVAGCQEIVLATPPRPDGSVSPEVMYVAQLVGASAVLKAGGAQAVAALAYGTATVPKVDKIFGPGNQWVTAAKMLVQNDTDALVSIDMPAGPSEVLVIADAMSNPAFVAADLLSQAEHGVDSQVVLVAIALSDSELAAIEREVDVQAHALARVAILRQSVAKSIIVRVGSPAEAVAFSNDYAPEHLILHLVDASKYVEQVQNAGSVFVGPYTPESCGDYASGTNHTLPTNGYARQFSGVNTQSFQKHITSQEITPAGLQKLGPIVATLADCEGLQAHANAVRIRLGPNAS